MTKTSVSAQNTRLWCERLVLNVSLAILTHRILLFLPIKTEEGALGSDLRSELIATWLISLTATFLYDRLSSSLSTTASQPSSATHSFTTSPFQPTYQFREQADAGIILGVFIVPFCLLSKAYLLGLHGYTGEVEGIKELLWGSIVCTTSLLLCLSIASARGSSNPFSFRMYSISLVVCGIVFIIVRPFIAGDLKLLPLIALCAIFYCIFRIALQFNKTFTFGEAVAMAQLISLFSVDAIRDVAFRINNSDNNKQEDINQKNSDIDQISWRSARDEVDIVIYVLLISILIIGVILSPIIRSLRRRVTPSNSTLIEASISLSGENTNQRDIRMNRSSIAFYGVLIASIVMGVFPILNILLREHPLLWIISFLLTQGRLLLAGYWVVLLGVSLYAVARPSNFLSNTPNIVVRKYFHALAILLFVPGVMFERQFLRLCFAVAISIFLLIEYIRLGNVPPFGKAIDGFMRSFTDKRDSGDVILTHTYLLLGCAMPLWLNSAISFHLLAPYAGILVLGVGDSMASVVGKKFGRNRWPGTSKTFEGTSAAIVSTFLAAAFIYFILQPLSASSSTTLWLSSSSSTSLTGLQWIGLGVATTLACLLESFTTQIDNLFLPLFYEALLSFCLN